MDKKRKAAAMLRHFNTLTPLMFYRTQITYVSKSGELLYWDNVFQIFTLNEVSIIFGNSPYRDDELTSLLFRAYEWLSILGVQETTLQVHTILQ
jgi:hypothetical protein